MKHDNPDETRKHIQILMDAGWSITEICEEACITDRMCLHIRRGERVPSQAVAKLLKRAAEGQADLLARLRASAAARQKEVA